MKRTYVRRDAMGRPASLSCGHFKRRDSVWTAGKYALLPGLVTPYYICIDSKTGKKEKHLKIQLRLFRIAFAYLVMLHLTHLQICAAGISLQSAADIRRRQRAAYKINEKG